MIFADEPVRGMSATAERPIIRINKDSAGNNCNSCFFTILLNYGYK